jgi:selenocysteine lyase/cysteine desulfurase
VSATVHPAPAKLSDYIGNISHFPILSRWDFFNHAGVSPLSGVAAEAMRAYAQQAETDVYLGTNWYVDVEKLRILAAGVINAHRDEIAFIKNTSEGISIVAMGIDWQWGDVIVTTSVEYPANVYPWMEVARSRGVKLVQVAEQDDRDSRRGVPVDDILQAAHNPKCRLVALSHVEFASGQRHDLELIGRYCRQHEKLLCVDAIQSMGVLPVDVQAMNIDFLAADGHKWMMGPEGAGIFYCRRELLERTRPLMIGWMNVVNAMEYGDYDYTLKPDAGRFECGTYNIPGLLGLKASLELLHRLGTDAIGARLKELDDRLIAGLILKGYHIVSPRHHEQWSGIVSFTSPKHEHEQIVKALRKEKKIEIALREGRLRASPHFYNTEQQIDRLIEALPRN